MFRKAMASDDATLSLDFSSGTMPTAVTFTRSDSTARATYMDVSGYVKTVTAAGDPRFDYTGGVAKGLLIESAATNSCRQSSNPASWSGSSSGATITTGTGLAPDNVATPKQVALTSSAYHYQITLTTLIAATYTFSMWLKASSSQQVGLRVNRAGSGSISAMTVANVTTSWQRFSISVTSNATDSIEIGFDQRNNGGVLQGPAVAATVLMWGAQLEQGASASSNIETTTAALTRLADDAVIRSTAWTSLYSKPGSIVVEYYRGEYGAGDRSVLAIDTAATKHIHLKHANASAASGIYNSAGTGVATKATGNTSGLNKAAFTWSSANPSVIKYTLNGNATVVSATSDIGATLGTWMTIGSQSTTGVSGSGTWDGYLNNSIKSIKYYSDVLSDADMIAKTT